MVLQVSGDLSSGTGASMSENDVVMTGEYMHLASLFGICLFGSLLAAPGPLAGTSNGVCIISVVKYS